MCPEKQGLHIFRVGYLQILRTVSGNSEICDFSDETTYLLKAIMRTGSSTQSPLSCRTGGSLSIFFQSNVRCLVDLDIGFLRQDKTNSHYLA